MPYFGCPSTSANPANETKADILIRADRHVNFDELASELGVTHGSAHNIVDFLDFLKVCAHWVLRQLTDDHKLEGLIAPRN